MVGRGVRAVSALGRLLLPGKLSGDLGAIWAGLSSAVVS